MEPCDAACRAAPVVVVGSGAAGLACALALAPMPVVVLTKTATPEGGSTLLAQGGIATVLGPTDSPELHAADTLAAGHGLSDPDRTSGMVREGPAAVRALTAAGLPIDRAADGTPLLGREAAHSRHRILHAGGDAIGRNLVATLLARVAQTPSIRLATATTAVDLTVEDGRIAGLLAHHGDDGWIAFDTPNVVIATGGIGALWRETTTPPEATGDGLALAARAGADLADLEFMQFHPTALVAEDGAGGARLPLLTEALRGAGARLIDDRGNAFMPEEHPLGDLAPRDVIARAIWRRRAANIRVFLDMRPALAGRGGQAFPQAIDLCRKAGIDPASTPAPVAPAAHYHMGGISTDAIGRTSLPGLWACGEAAATGVHGANRLASNSLLEALVFARRIGEAIRADAAPPDRAGPRRGLRPAIPRIHGAGTRATRDRIRTAMSRHAGIDRDAPGLRQAAAELQRLQEAFDSQADPEKEAGSEQVGSWNETRNMLLIGRLVVQAALRRQESRGAHFRRDFPRPRDDWARHLTLTIADLEPMSALARG